MTARKWRSPAMLFAVLLVLALATLGVGYGLWDKILYIDGTVNTGEVDAEWTSCFCFDSGLDLNPDGTLKDKDVGSTTCTIDVGDSQLLHFTVDNGYPSYFTDCQVEFTNTGTIPFKPQNFGVTPLNFTLASDYGAADGQVWVEFVNGCGVQMEPGDDAASSVKIHVEQPAEENWTYDFEVWIQLVQWNEFEQALCP